MPVKQRRGVVVSDKMDKTIVVAVENRVVHSKYRKVLVRTKRYKVHDENNVCKIGDRVRIHETKPLSRHKRWIVDEVLKSEEHVFSMIEATSVEENLLIHSTVGASFPREVSVGERCTLEINLSLNLSDSSLFDTLKSKTIKIGAFISISDLDFELDAKMKVVELSPESQANSQIFHMVPKQEGERVIGIDFFQSSRYLGRKEVQTRVVKAENVAVTNRSKPTGENVSGSNYSRTTREHEYKQV